MYYAHDIVSFFKKIIKENMSYDSFYLTIWKPFFK